MMVYKEYCSYLQVETELNRICEKMNKDGYKPDVIIAISRGGLIPGVILSHMLNLPLETIKVTTRETFTTTDNFDPGTMILKKVLVIDDICDSGKTFNMIKDLFSNHTPEDIKYAAIYQKNNDFPVDYYGIFHDKEDWIVYPWEIQ